MSLPPADLIFEGALLADGSGAPLRRAEVAVAGDRILAVAERLADELKRGAGRLIPAQGLVLAPGFIDVHAHGELEPLLDTSAASKVTGGVTCEISGNCGCTPFPLRGAARARWEREARESFGWEPGRLDWTEADTYLERLETAGSTINRGFLLGHGTLRAAVLGYQDRPAAEEDLREMHAGLERALEAGLFGLSTGLEYPPGCFAGEEEVQGLARICARHGALYTSHMRSEGGQLEEALAETLRVTRATGVQTQVSHLKTSRPANWPKIDSVERMLRGAREEGLPVFADRYPYTACGTGLDWVLPRWCYAGGNEEELKRIKDEGTWRRIAGEVEREIPDPAFWSGVRLSNVSEPELRARVTGRSIGELAKEWLLEPLAVLRRILIEDRVRSSAIFFAMSEPNLERILGWEFVMVASDATARNVEGPTACAHAHPRAFGTFTRVLAEYVRRRGLFSLGEAIHRMSGLPARTFHLADRGQVAAGYFADLVLFDAERVQDQATFAAPNRFSTGIEQVYVNGKQVVERGKILPARPGRVLRHSA